MSMKEFFPLVMTSLLKTIFLIELSKNYSLLLANCHHVFGIQDLSVEKRDPGYLFRRGDRSELKSHAQSSDEYA